MHVGYLLLRGAKFILNVLVFDTHVLFDGVHYSEPVVAITVHLHGARLNEDDLLDRLEVVSAKLTNDLKVV